MPANLENSTVAAGLEKVNFHFNPKERQSKECSNYHTMALISHASQAVLKILQARLKHYMNHELPDVLAGFRKGRGTRDQIANICWIIEKAREFQKNIYFCFIGYAKAFDCVNHSKLENFSRDGNARPPDLPPEKSAYRSKSNSYFCFIGYAKAFDCVNHSKLENFSRDGNARPPDLPPEKSAYRSKSNS